LAVPHSALGYDMVCEMPHLLGGPAQNRDFEAGLLVEMDVQRRDEQIMMVILERAAKGRKLRPGVVHLRPGLGTKLLKTIDGRA
jgi:hypothetical protein